MAQKEATSESAKKVEQLPRFWSAIEKAKTNMHDDLVERSKPGKILARDVETIYDILLKFARGWEEGMARDFAAVNAGTMTSKKFWENAKVSDRTCIFGSDEVLGPLSPVQREIDRECGASTPKSEIAKICAKWARLCQGTLVNEGKGAKPFFLDVCQSNYEYERRSKDGPSRWRKPSVTG